MWISRRIKSRISKLVVPQRKLGQAVMTKKRGKTGTAEERHKRFVEENREWNKKVDESLERMKKAVRESSDSAPSRR